MTSESRPQPIELVYDEAGGYDSMTSAFTITGIYLDGHTLDLVLDTGVEWWSCKDSTQATAYPEANEFMCKVLEYIKSIGE